MLVGVKMHEFKIYLWWLRRDLGTSEVIVEFDTHLSKQVPMSWISASFATNLLWWQNVQ